MPYILGECIFLSQFILSILSNGVIMRLLHLLMGLSDLLPQKSGFLFTRRINDVFLSSICLRIYTRRRDHYWGGCYRQLLIALRKVKGILI